MSTKQKITPCLWFNFNAEEAVNHYLTIFKRSKISRMVRYGGEMPELKGKVMVIQFEVEGQEYQAINGGPQFPFTEAISLSVDCADQAEVDELWARLAEGGSAGRCGWLKDKFGLSWQIVPRALVTMLNDPDSGKSARVMQAMLTMSKIDIASLQKAYNHQESMSANMTTTSTEGRDLVLTRIIDAPREKVFQAWTDPALLKQWFAPLPWTTPVVETDVRVGGLSLIVMRGPDGGEFPNRGVYLEVVKNERLVLTDAFTKAWEPSEKPFMAVELTFEDQDGKTKYSARVHHWTVADRETHEKMGFHQGWTQCAEQLAALVEKSRSG